MADDRAEYASLQAILFGPYLLAGLTSGDWDISTGNSSSISDWITAVPASYNSQLVSLVQESDSRAFVFSHFNGSLTMEEWPAEGTNSALHATFRAIFPDSGSKHGQVIASMKSAQTSVMLEPIDVPGMVVTRRGPSNDLAVAAADATDDCVFNVVQGLDGKKDTVSLESSAREGCFVSGGVESSAGGKIRLMCISDSAAPPDASFRRAASFTPVAGLRPYNPISFTAKGKRRNFLLEPLLSLRDENYTVYFKTGA